MSKIFVVNIYWLKKWKKEPIWWIQHTSNWDFSFVLNSDASDSNLGVFFRRRHRSYCYQWLSVLFQLFRQLSTVRKKKRFNFFCIYFLKGECICISHSRLIWFFLVVFLLMPIFLVVVRFLYVLFIYNMFNCRIVCIVSNELHSVKCTNFENTIFWCTAHLHTLETVRQNAVIPMELTALQWNWNPFIKC